MKRIKNEHIKNDKLKQIVRNEAKLTDFCSQANFLRKTLVDTTNRMNLRKLKLANALTKLFVHSEIIPCIQIFPHYVGLIDIDAVFAKPENNDFNREFFADILTPEGLGVLDQQEKDSLSLWVADNISLTQKQQTKAYRSVKPKFPMLKGKTQLMLQKHTQNWNNSNLEKSLELPQLKGQIGDMAAFAEKNNMVDTRTLKNMGGRNNLMIEASKAGESNSRSAIKRQPRPCQLSKIRFRFSAFYRV